ncbi:uncharacterized protein DUF3887 [Streptomyces sp. Ag109_G2-6]|uniref:DUF3887 domain-containing protein n=1 Tax=Streptomyces TaxID=1883 RepID=UPI0009A47622|nr:MULTISPECIES: DUF3887 domain-containing protein [Streptomyces]RPF43867.1 uncharacterized protein DUF3887 [Streptomyces sp. Ag109_G2-6]
MAVTRRRIVSVRSGVAAVAAAAALCVVADGSAAAVAPARPVASAPEMTVPARDSFTQPALDTLDEVVRGDFDAVWARFDTALRGQVSPEALRKSWDAYQLEFGRYLSHGEPRQTVVGAGTVVSVPLRMAKQPGEFRVTFDKDGRLGGLWFLRAGVPLS